MHRSHVAVLAATTLASLVCSTVAVSAATSPPSSDLGPEIDSEFQAGYFGDGGSDYLQATFTVPQFTCAPDETRSSAIFLEGWGYDFDIGDVLIGGGAVYTACEEGAKRFEIVLYSDDVLPVIVDEPVASGDRVRITYDALSSARSVSSVANVTKDWSATTGPFFTPYVSADEGQVGVRRHSRSGGNPEPLVARYVFDKVTVDGTKLRRGQWQSWTLVDLPGYPILEPTAVKRGGFKIKPA